MFSRGKKIVSLIPTTSVAVKTKYQFATDDVSTSNACLDVVKETQSEFNSKVDTKFHPPIIIIHDCPQSEIPISANTDIEPVPHCSTHQLEVTLEGGSDIEKELESLFGDISDTDDPTYHPPNEFIQQENEDSDDLITLEELLGTKENDSAIQLDREQVKIQSFEQSNRQHNDAIAIVENLLSELFKKAWLLIQPLKRWRKLDPNNWACNVAKKRRADGLPYQIRAKDRPAKVPKEIDCSTCQFKCSDIFSATERDTICRFFWNLNFKSRKNFILANVTIQPPKRVLTARKRPAPKQYSKKCFFSKLDEKKQVCQNFFCKTLCISPAVIKDAIKKRNEMNLFDGTDQRGLHEPINKSKPEAIQGVRKHIESFPCMEAHYCRKDTQRKYLEKNLNVRKMHLMYKEECLKNGSEPVSEITYRRIFGNEYNLSFFVPRKDQCLVCTNYVQADTEKKKELEEAHLAHLERKMICNSEKDKDKARSNIDPNFSSITFDLQAVLQIPACEVGLLYYSRKLCVYNLTIYEAPLPNNAYCLTWSEVHGKKGSSEIGTILLHYLTNCVSSDITEITLFSDTCGGQNRNQFVAALLLWAVQKIDHLKVIEQKFLESGHTQMEVDSMHSSIESAKKNSSVFSMVEWISIFKRARRKQCKRVGGKKITIKPYEVKEFKYDEFFDLKHLANMIIMNRTKDDKGQKVQWLKIKQIKYVKGEENKIFFNYDMSENFNTINVGESPSTSQSNCATVRHSTRTKRSRTDLNTSAIPVKHQFPDQLQRLYQEPLRISEAKKKDLITLCRKGIIPEELHGWFENLKSDKRVRDKLPEPAISDDESESGDDV